MTEQEEFEFRARLERERQGRAAPADDMAARAARSGTSMRNGQVNWGVELQKQMNSEMSMPERVFKSLGDGFADIPLAVKQMFARDRIQQRKLESQAADKREVDADLAKKTDLGVMPDRVMGMETPTLGGFAQGYGKTVPLMALPAGGALGTAGSVGMAAFTGGLAGALEPTIEGESRAKNVATGAVTSSVLPLATAAVKPVWSMVSRSGGQNRAAQEVAEALSPEKAQQEVVLRQTIDRLRAAQQPRPGAPNIPLSTAAQLRDAELARLEAGSRTRSGANWYDFDQGQARAVSDAVREATAQAEDLAARRTLRSSNRATNVNQAMSSLNEGAFTRDLQGFRNNLEAAMRTPDASDPAVRSMLTELRSELDRLGPDFTPDHLATIRANLSSKSPLVPQNAYQAAPRSSPATMSVLNQVDNILNNATGNRWQNVVSGYARDSDAVRAAQAAGKVREAFWDSTGQVKKKSADVMGDVPIITEFGLRQAMNSTAGPQKNLLLSTEANNRLNAVVDALRAQGIVQGVKRSATAGGGANTASDIMAARTAGAMADVAANAAGGPAATVGKGVLEGLRAYATANKDRALAEALQNPQQMVALLERKLQAGAPMSPQEQYFLSILRAAPATAVTAQ